MVSHSFQGSKQDLNAPVKDQQKPCSLPLCWLPVLVLILPEQQDNSSRSSGLNWLGFCPTFLKRSRTPWDVQIQTDASDPTSWRRRHILVHCTLFTRKHPSNTRRPRPRCRIGTSQFGQILRLPWYLRDGHSFSPINIPRNLASPFRTMRNGSKPAIRNACGR